MIIGIYNISPIATGGVVPSKSQCNRRFILNTDNFLSTFDGVDENSEVFQEYLDETILTCLDKYGYIRGTYTFQTTKLIQCYPLECGYVLKSDRQKYFDGENLIDSFQPYNNNERSETDFNSQKGIEPMHDVELRQKIESILPEGWKFKDFIDTSDLTYAGGFRVTCPLDDRMGKTYHEKINAICEGVNAICDGGGWACGSDIYTNWFYLKKENSMDVEQEEKLDVAMDVALDEGGDPEDPPLLLPQFWSQEEKDGVKNMLADKDESLRRLAQRIVDTWSGDGICTKHMTINKTGRDQYGTFTFEACGGFNYSLSRNAPYYFNQIATMMMFAKNWGVKVWPIKMKFDVADDLWTAEFGIDFNFDDNIAFIRKGAKEIGCIEPEEELEEATRSKKPWTKTIQIDKPDRIYTNEQIIKSVKGELGSEHRNDTAATDYFARLANRIEYYGLTDKDFADVHPYWKSYVAYIRYGDFPNPGVDRNTIEFGVILNRAIEILQDVKE